MRISERWRRRVGNRLTEVTSRSGFLAIGRDFRTYWEFGQGEPVVLVPGLAGGVALVAQLARFLGDHYRVLCLEPCDEGAAFLYSPPRSLDDLAREQQLFIEALGLERATVVGVSFGATVALRLALRAPARVHTLIVSGAGTHSSTLTATVLQELLDRYQFSAESTIVNRFFESLFGGQEQPGELLRFVTRRCWDTGQATIAHRLGLLSQFDVRRDVGRIQAPALVIAGRDDRIVRWEAQLALAEALPKGRFVAIDGAGHLCFVTRPRRFASLVHRFLQETANDTELGQEP